MTWVDLITGEGRRDLSFALRGPDGRLVTELRGTVTVSNESVVALAGTSVEPKQPGAAMATIEVGNVKADVPILVYQRVASFVGNSPRLRLMAMPVTLARGDTVVVPIPRGSFWVTYLSKDPNAAPPTIELLGDGACTTGDGIHIRRIESGTYAKYCYARDGARMRVAHGVGGADTVIGTVAVRIEW